ncbi:hypothetical protein ACLK1T_03035 [Escherichia coli]
MQDDLTSSSPSRRCDQRYPSRFTTASTLAIGGRAGFEPATN